MNKPVTIQLVGGFLGAGKTTAITRLATRAIASGRRVAIITNDQADNLVDTALVRASGLDAREVARGCFCCRFDELVATVDQLEAESQPDLIIAEPVGSCTDLVATVINPLRSYYAGRFLLTPFTVLVDPVRALRVLGGEERVGLSARVAYIYRMQQQECDAIGISKIDLLSTSDRDRVASLLSDHFPGRRLFAFSSATGEGFEEWAAWLGSNVASGQVVADLDYDVYAAGEADLGWLNNSLSLSGDTPFDMDDVVLDLADRIREALGRQNLAIAHGKMLISNGKDLATVNVVDDDVRPILSRASGATAATAALTMNWRVQAAPAAVTGSVEACLQEWLDRRQLRITSGAGQCFTPGRPVPRHRLGADGREMDDANPADRSA
jgi:Ni2+-binding GTPase involved in maturation of urease and hydrogenase